MYVAGDSAVRSGEAEFHGQDDVTQRLLVR